VRSAGRSAIAALGVDRPRVANLHRHHRVERDNGGMVGRASPWAPAGCSDQGADRGSGGQQDDAA
jgi:hypothetical protein